MFAMCSATDSFDIALAAEGVDICEPMFDGDESEANYQSKIDYSKTSRWEHGKTRRTAQLLPSHESASLSAQCEAWQREQRRPNLHKV